MMAEPMQIRGTCWKVYVHEGLVVYRGVNGQGENIRCSFQRDPLCPGRLSVLVNSEGHSIAQNTLVHLFEEAAKLLEVDKCDLR